MSTTTKVLPLKRKIEEAFAGWLVDKQKADPTFLTGLPIICLTTGRAPDDPKSGQDNSVSPEAPYLKVFCGKTIDAPDFPQGYGMKHAFPLFGIVTQSDDASRAVADGHAAALEQAFYDVDAIKDALNQPIDATATDARRVKGLYIYDLLDLEDEDPRDPQDPNAWDDALVLRVLCQPGDPEQA